ncbi:MAG: formylglycine-generating enzyme family protein [Candidatus Electrothrix scaldis]|nr:MAG: formylglycine-generating enzyme family protein [Candidatus Electrothrix sp. GW3-3]
MSLPETLHTRSRTGRADLLYFLKQSDQATLAAAALLFGYQAPEKRQEPKKPNMEEQRAIGSHPELLPSQEKQQRQQKPGTQQRFFRLKEKSRVLDEERVTQVPQRLLDATPFSGSLSQARTEGKGEGGQALPPEPPALAPWPRIWPFLRAVLGAQDQSRQLDLDRIVRSLARGEVLRRLPCLPRTGWAATAQIIVDLDPQIHFFWHDFYSLLAQLQGMRGRAGLDMLCFEDGPLEFCTAFAPEHRTRQTPYRPPEAGTPILILSDLGLLNNRAEGWIALGRRFRRAGCRPVVLMPCPERYWKTELTEYYQLVVWDHDRRYPVRCDRLKPQAPHVQEREQDPGLDALLIAAAAAVRVEPGLLRALRLLFPAQDMDVGTEAAVWRHGEVDSDMLAFHLHPEAKERYAALLAEKLQNVVQEVDAYQQIFACLQAFHAHLPQEIRFEEEMQRARLLDKQPDKPASEFMWQVAATIYGQAKEYPYLPHLKSWVCRLAERQQQECWTWKDGEAMAIALALVLLEHYDKDEDIPFPAGFNINHVAWLLDDKEAQEYELRQEMDRSGRRLVLYPLAAAERKKTGSMFMARLQMSNSRLQWRHVQADGLGGPVHFLDIRTEREIPVPEQGALEIQGNFDRLLIDGMTRPDWANIAQGRLPDGREYFHLLTRGEEKKELAWCNPGEYPVRDKEGNRVAVFAIEKGFFAVLDEADEIRELGFTQPQWAKQIGVDQYGLYADLVFKGVIQRFRWIQPGSFMMGSPDDELERWEERETQHLVVLSESFWLADTACTQALWQAVIGKNPSHFKGDERPVEQVSWQDAQKFIKQLNKEIPVLALDLPTEAQWEYACRAGTSSPFFFGENISTDQVNYNGKYPYAGGEKGLYREETVEVKALPCNDWGLYQMHGNVWEWCRDWLGDYSSKPVVDPLGPDTGRFRVLRGGSWISDGGDCRSAARSGSTPDYRSSSLGFRLARGRTGQAR